MTSASTTAGSGRFLAGALAGLAGGVLMLAQWVLHADRAGLGAALPLQLVAATLHGVEALLDGAGVQAAGLAMHLGLAAVLGTAFSLTIDRTVSLRFALLAGMGYALALLLVMRYLVVPVIDPVMGARIALDGTWFAAAHLWYGAGLALTAPLWRWLAAAQHPRRWTAPSRAEREAQPRGRPVLPRPV